jgi:predicted metal-dependent phosphoesterase TrpH
MVVKADLHVHSAFSPDSMITPKDLVFYARKCGLNAVAVTDHNRVEGALKIAKQKLQSKPTFSSSPASRFLVLTGI